MRYLRNKNQKIVLQIIGDGKKSMSVSEEKCTIIKVSFTIQTLIKNGHTNEALSFTQKLTESIAVEMSAINTNHPVVNAVLNQKYRSMQEKHIAVILKVGEFVWKRKRL